MIDIVRIFWFHGLNLMRNVWNEWEPNDINDSIVPEEIIAVTWCDSDISQIKAIVDKEQQTSDYRDKIIANKHSAAQSAAEQPVDLSRVFKVLRNLQKYIDADKHVGSKVMTNHINSKSDTYKDVLHLSTKKHEILVNFLSTLPSMVSVACSQEKSLMAFWRVV